MTTLGFQDLPPEMRLEVYRNISPPLNGHISTSKGLFLSCKAIKAEMEHAIVENMNKYLGEMRDEWSQTYGTELRTTSPQSVLEVKDGFTVWIPLSFFRRENRYHAFPRPLLRLFPLHVGCISLTFYEDIPGITQMQRFGQLSFEESLIATLCRGSVLELDDGTLDADPNARLCTDALSLVGAWVFEGEENEIIESLWNGHRDFWFEEFTNVPGPFGREIPRRTWYRLVDADEAGLPPIDEKHIRLAYARDLPDRN